MTKLYDANDHVIIHTGYSDPVMHCHKGSHIIVSLGGHIRVTTDHNFCSCRGIMIPSGIAHQIDTDHKPVLVFLYDSTTHISRSIKTLQSLPDVHCSNIVKLYADWEKNGQLTQYSALDHYIRTLIIPSENEIPVIDHRITAAKTYIQTSCTEHLSCRDVASTIYLSSGRFSHLFHQQAGMTFASYLIYQRLMLAYKAIIQGYSFTEAALSAGFSSSSHFSDVNRRIFGLRPRIFFKDLIYEKLT